MSKLKKTNNEIMIDRSGDSGDILLNAGVVICGIEDAAEARGFASAMDWLGSLIVGNSVNRPDRLQSWFTHFAVVLEFSRDGVCDLWLLERHTEGRYNFKTISRD